MENFYFPLDFCDPCFYATVQKFRLLDYVILLYASPWHHIKKPGICFQ